MKKITLIGPESTGKSTLAKQLAEHFKTVYVPEYAREYVESLSRDYTYSDLTIIAKKQVELENNALEFATKYLFLDTDLIVTKIWFEKVYQSVPRWINKKILENKANFYLLCSTDIDWIADSVRENGGKCREELFELYKLELQKIGVNFKILKGRGEERFKNALQHISDYEKKSQTNNSKYSFDNHTVTEPKFVFPH